MAGALVVVAPSAVAHDPGPVPPPPDVASAPPRTTYADRIAPPRVPGWEHALALRPMGGSLFGIMTEASTTWRSEAPLFVRGRLHPAGAAAGWDGTAKTVGVGFEAGYDGHLLALGAGVGTMYVDVIRNGRFARGFVPVLTQTARLGARDGLHLAFSNHLALFGTEAWYAGSRATLQMPLGRDWIWFLLRGGGSMASERWGELCLRMHVRHAGNRSGLFIVPCIGVAALVDADAVAFGAAPAMAFEWRR